MIKALLSAADRFLLMQEVARKQRLYAQMMKDQINGPVLKKLSEEIGQLNLQLYGHGSNQQRA